MSEPRTVPHLVTEIPGPLARAAVADDGRVTSPSLGRVYPIVAVRGEGCAIEDIDGNIFLDLMAGIAVNSTGHCHPEVVAAIRDQAARLLHLCGGDFFLPSYTELCAELVRIAPMSGPCRALLANSGAEAVEAAIKLARHSTGRSGIVAFLGAFHGRTMGALSLTASKAKYHEGFGPLLNGVYHAPFGRVADLAYFDEVLFDKLIPAHEVAAIIVEPIQGEGGYLVPEPGFIAGLRAICDRHGILLIADEVQSGAGRTGRMWAIEHEGVEPDILLTAKGLGSGMPISGVVARSPLMDSWHAGHHGSTYGGNPVANVAALATIRLLEGGLIEAAATRGEQFSAGLRAIASRYPGVITDVRGRGLMIGLELDTPERAHALEMECFVRGALVLQAGRSVIRLAPPLVISQAEVETALEILEQAVAAVAG